MKNFYKAIFTSLCLLLIHNIDIIAMMPIELKVIMTLYLSAGFYFLYDELIKSAIQVEAKFKSRKRAFRRRIKNVIKKEDVVKLNFIQRLGVAFAVLFINVFKNF